MLLFQRPACREKTWQTTTRAATVSLSPRTWRRGWRLPSGPSGTTHRPHLHPHSQFVFDHHSSLCSRWFAADETLNSFCFLFTFFLFLFYFAHPRVKGRHRLLGKTSQCGLQVATLSVELLSLVLLLPPVAACACPTVSFSPFCCFEEV